MIKVDLDLMFSLLKPSELQTSARWLYRVSQKIMPSLCSGCGGFVDSIISAFTHLHRSVMLQPQGAPLKSSENQSGFRYFLRGLPVLQLEILRPGMGRVNLG